MKTLVIISIIMTSCGGAEDLANAINNASATHKNGANGANQPAPTSSTVTTAETTTSSSATSSTTTTVTTTSSAASRDQTTETAPSDVLDGTIWNTECENGLSYKAAFAKGIETLTTQVYQDSDCKVIGSAVDQKLNYAIDGDDIQFNEGKAGEFKNGQPFQTMTMVNNTLSFSGNADQVYHKISK